MDIVIETKIMFFSSSASYFSYDFLFPVKILENLNSNSLAKAKILWSVGQWPREARMMKEKELKNVLGLSLYVLVT